MLKMMLALFLNPRTNILLALMMLIFLIVAPACSPAPEQRVNVYNWSDSFPPGLLEDFERETGIKVYADSFDSNDTLEAKLLLGISGYDVVFPSLWPYFARQAKAGLFLKLDRNQLNFWKDLDPHLVIMMKAADPELAYGIPYTWGAIGIAYNRTILKTIPNLPFGSVKLLVDAETIAKVAHCGVAFMEEALDVIPMAMRYLRTADRQKAVEHLLTIRPHIRRFNWSRSLQDLANGELCVAQTLFSSAYKLNLDLRATNSANEILVYVPEEGAPMWIDTIAIPKSAPNVSNAYRFINFIMRPENISKITNHLYDLNSNMASLPYLTEEARKLHQDLVNVRHKLFQAEIMDRAEIKAYGEAMEQIIYGVAQTE